MTSGEIVVDLAAIRHNVRELARIADPAALMVVVKADGYGHGMAEVARAAREAGAPWLGVATLDEALALRSSGDTGRLLCWLAVPGERWADGVAADVDLTAYSVTEVDEIAAAAEGLGRRARLQVKVDTGLTRGGAPRSAWSEVFAAVAAHQRAGSLELTGIWSHLASSDEPDHPANDAQEAAYAEALAAAAEAGLQPGLRHLANSAATLLRPSARWDLVRCGIAAYGLDPAPGVAHEADLVPAMTVRARLAMVKDAAPGDGVSYGHTWVADAATTVGLVPAGYGEGVPRHAGNRAEAWVAGRRRPVRGRICMDQCVVDLGGDRPAAGEWAVLWGSGRDGEPTAQDWAEACETINYEIVTRIGGRLRRRHVDSEQEVTR